MTRLVRAPGSAGDDLVRQRGWRRERIDVGDVALSCVVAGEGPLVVLLHGFPECWYSWRSQIDVLREAGFRVAAPDLRGYGGSDRPRGVQSYFIDAVMGDIVGLIHALGEDRAAVVGHDWGGIITFYLGMHHRDALTRVAVLNAPHPGPYQRAVRRWNQFRRSWYAQFFRIPRMPEILLSAGDLRSLETLFRNEPARDGAFTTDDIAVYKQAYREAGGMNGFAGPLNYYRSLFVSPNAERVRRAETSDVPTLVIWGDRDRHLNLDVTRGLDEWITDLRVEHVPNASHWVQHDEPEVVSDLLVRFLSPASSTR